MPKYSLPQPLFDTLEHILDTNQPKLMFPADYRAAKEFLRQYINNISTFESYRREIERLLQWSSLIAKKSILKLKREDIENYLEFCLNPPKSWIGFKRVARFITKNGSRIPNPAWRPFVATVSKFEHKKGLEPNKQDYQLSQKAIREIFTVLSSFYNFLLLEEKISINPVAVIRQKSKYIQKYQKQAPVRRLTEKQWETCINIVKQMAAGNPKEHERTLFIISALYLLYLRISELVANNRWIPQMNHFYKDSNGYWWFKTVGKGNKMRDIAVPDDMLLSLQQYRKNMSLPPLPSIDDKTPLLPKTKGKGAMTSSRHVRRLVQYCFDKTISHLRKTGFSADADELESATVHWLRHTGISDDINKRGRAIAHVRDDAGHSSSAITDRYNDIELTERYKSAKKKKLNIVTRRNKKFSN